MHQILEDVHCTIISPWKKKTKKSLKAQNDHEIHPHDEWMGRTGLRLNFLKPAVTWFDSARFSRKSCGD